MKQILLLLLSTTAVLSAAPLQFDFKDPKGVNNVIFKTDAPLETITGSATGVSGKVTFDPAHPETLQGRIVVAASSLHVGNPMMKEHLHSTNWLSVTEFPEIIFEIGEAKNVKQAGDAIAADVSGRLTVHGVTHPITVPVKLTYLKDKLRARGGTNKDGDLLVVRSTFKILRSDYGINAAKFEDKVSNEIELTLGLAGMSPR